MRRGINDFYLCGSVFTVCSLCRIVLHADTAQCTVPLLALNIWLTVFAAIAIVTYFSHRREMGCRVVARALTWLISLNYVKTNFIRLTVFSYANIVGNTIYTRLHHSDRQFYAVVLLLHRINVPSPFLQWRVDATVDYTTSAIFFAGLLQNESNNNNEKCGRDGVRTRKSVEGLRSIFSCYSFWDLEWFWVLEIELWRVRRWLWVIVHGGERERVCDGNKYQSKFETNHLPA